MSLCFFPSRERMYKEIEQWIALNKLDLLLGLCNCCVYKAHHDPLARECRTCTINKGINKIVREGRRTPVLDEELLGVC